MRDLRTLLFAALAGGAVALPATAPAQNPLTPFLRDVAAQNAPYIIQEVYLYGGSAPSSLDHLMPVDFDGDVNGANNGINSHSMSGPPSVYFSITETGSSASEGYYFIGYYFYHPNDGGFHPYGGLIPGDNGHEHDMEGIFLVVKKTSYLPYGRPIMALSEAHGALIPYYNPGWLDPENTLSEGGTGSWGGKINYWFDPEIGGAPRVVAAVRSSDHGTYMAQRCDEPLDEYGGMIVNRPDPYTYGACIHNNNGLVVYQPAIYPWQVVQLPLYTTTGLWRYQLIHVAESPMWMYRDYNPLLFSGTVIQIGPGLYAYDIFNPADRYKSTANPPWAWIGGAGRGETHAGNGGYYYTFTEDGTTSYHYSPGQWPTIPVGSLLTDPAAAARRYFPRYSSFNEPTLYNAYISGPPPCCQELSGGIGGPDGGTYGVTTTWTAEVYGGTPPYTYQWGGVMGSGTQSTFTRAPQASGNLYLDVWDAAGGHIAVSKWIEVSDSCGGLAC